MGEEINEVMEAMAGQVEENLDEVVAEATDVVEDVAEEIADVAGEAVEEVAEQASPTVMENITENIAETINSSNDTVVKIVCVAAGAGLVIAGALLVKPLKKLGSKIYNSKPAVKIREAAKNRREAREMKKAIAEILVDDKPEEKSEEEK